MPADYSSAAAALALSPTLPSPDEVPSPYNPADDDANPRPSWARARSGTSSRRLGFTHNRRPSTAPTIRSTLRDALSTATSIANRATTFILRLPPLQRAAILILSLVIFILTILAIIYSHAIWGALAPAAKGWRELPAGWLILWALVVVVSFPPVVGYSTVCTLSGFVYGFPLGWPIIASGTVVGSTAAFMLSRGVLGNYVHGLVGADKRFVALGQVLRKDGLLVLTGVRFAPLPYSLSNGFLATIPSIRPWAFAASTAMASPKLLVHVFIGSRLALLAEEGDKMSAGDKAINYISVMVSGLIGIVVGIFVYRRTMARAEEIVREEAEAARANGGARRGSSADLEAGYADDASENTGLMMDPDVADAALMGDDDISLWGADDNFEDAPEIGYRDSGEAGGNGAARGSGGYADDGGAVNGNGTRK